MNDFPHTDFSEALGALGPITLEEMDGITLMNRIDTKYLTDEATLLKILSDAARDGYRVLEVNGDRIGAYDSVYFDTEGMKCFLDHHNRRLVRQKVRTRSYVKQGKSFLEIKRKDNKGRTSKKRIAIPVSEMMDFREDAQATAFLAAHSWFTAADLSPSAETSFQRITLVNAAETERLTIDTALYFRNFRTGKEASLRNAVIIELKQDGRASSPMKGILLDHRVKPVRISKYCIAVTLTAEHLKTGRFKTKVRTIEKVINHKIMTI